jgi:O-antigen/teichoic acid export membrane protein
MRAAILRSTSDRGIGKWAAASHLANVAMRYGLSSFGPAAISGAHFLASLIFLRSLSRDAFGQLSFLLVIVPFGLSISGALVGASVSRVAARNGGLDDAELSTHLKVNLLYSMMVGAGVLALLHLSHAGWTMAAALGLYAGLMALRWFGRNLAYALKSPLRVTVSDLTYAGVLIAGLGVLQAVHGLDVGDASIALLLAAAAGLAALGTNFLRQLLLPPRAGAITAFGDIWQELARWSVLGVFLTELTANAHVYLVTFLFGPASFALLAVGSLLMRPVVLVLSALPDMERPEMARRIAAGDHQGALRCVKEFRTAAGAVWLATLLLAGAVLMWFPSAILKHGYDAGEVLVVLAIWGAISAVRVARTPESVLLQAAGQFRPLAGASAWSSLVSLTVTLALALFFGPVVSLLGVLSGELVMTGRILSLSRRWQAAHG